jgi:hypothetical protein
MKKPEEDWSQFDPWGHGIMLPPINPVQAAWCLLFFVTVLLISTVYFISAYKAAQSNLEALCAEVRKLPDVKTAQADLCPPQIVPATPTPLL